MYYLKIISLQGCPYSEAVEKLVKNKFSVTGILNDDLKLDL